MARRRFSHALGSVVIRGSAVAAAAAAPLCAAAPAVSAAEPASRPVVVHPGVERAERPPAGEKPLPEVPFPAAGVAPAAADAKPTVWPVYREQVRAAAKRLPAAGPATQPATLPKDAEPTPLELSKARAILNNDPAPDDETLSAAASLLMAADWTPESRQDIAARLVTIAPGRFPAFVRQAASRGWADMVMPVLHQRERVDGAMVEAAIRALAGGDPDLPAALLQVAATGQFSNDRAGPDGRRDAPRPVAPSVPVGRSDPVRVDGFGPLTPLPPGRQPPILPGAPSMARVTAIELLDRLGADDPARLRPLPPGGVDALRRMLFDGPDSVAQAAADALHRRKQLTDAEREMLRYEIPSLLTSRDVEARLRAARRLGPQVDQPIVAAAVGRALQDDATVVRREVVRALLAAGPKAKAVAGPVAELVAADRPPTPTWLDDALLDDATGLLMRMDPTPPEVVPVVAKLLKAEPRRDVGELLVAAAGPAALPTLDKTYAAAGDDPAARAAVARVLGQPELRGKDAEGRLLEILAADQSPAVRAAAAAGLGRSTQRAADARRALTAAVADPDRRARAAAADALVRLGPGADVPVPPVAELVKSGTSAERAAGARLLAALGARATAEAAADLARMADNVNPVLRWSAAAALAQVDAKGEYVSRAVVAAVRHQDAVALDRLLRPAGPGTATRQAGVAAAAAAAAARKPAVDARTLTTLAALAADDPDPGVRRMAKQAGDRLGGAEAKD